MIIAEDRYKTMRVKKSGDMYLLEEKKYCLLIFSQWDIIDETDQEKMASKWILDNKLWVIDDYPTIAEIGEMQKNG